MATPTKPDRNLLESCFRGWSWLLTAIAAALGLVLLLLLALGAPLLAQGPAGGLAQSFQTASLRPKRRPLEGAR